MPRFDINKYDTVDARLSRFWDEHPNGAVHTELITDGNVITTFLAIRASVWFDRADPIPAGQGIAYGQADADGRSVDATSWVENCDTSAVGRALANAGYKAKKDSPRPSREEMETVTDPRRMEPNERQQVDAQHERNTAPPQPRQPEPSRLPATRRPMAPTDTQQTPADAPVSVAADDLLRDELRDLGTRGFDLGRFLTGRNKKIDDLSRVELEGILPTAREVVRKRVERLTQQP